MRESAEAGEKGKEESREEGSKEIREGGREEKREIGRGNDNRGEQSVEWGNKGRKMEDETEGAKVVTGGAGCKKGGEQGRKKQEEGEE